MSVQPVELAIASRTESKLEDGKTPRAAAAAVADGENDFREGGLRGWLNVLGATLVLFATFGYVSSFGVYQSYYSTNQLASKTASDISWIGSVAIGVEFSMAFVVGPLFDKGYFRICLVAGSVLYTLSVFMVSLARSYASIFLAQGIALGVSMGLLYIPSVSVLSQFFQQRRSLVIGIAMAGSSVGGIIFPIMLNRLFASIGFEEGVRASGYIVLGALLLANLVMKSKYPFQDPDLPKHKGPSPRKLLSEPRYLLTVIGTTFLCLGVFFPIAYLQVFAENADLSQNISDYVLAIFNAASLFGRILPNHASDYFGTFNALLVISTGLTTMIFALYGVTSPASLLVVCVLLGFCSGGFVSLLAPVLISTALNPREVGTRQGLTYLFNGVAALTSSPIAGALLEAGGGDFKYAIAFTGGISALGTVLLVGARMFQAKQMGTWKV